MNQIEPFFFEDASNHLGNMLSGRMHDELYQMDTFLELGNLTGALNRQVSEDGSNEFESLERKDFGKKRILIVDDQIFNINALMIMIRCFTKVNPDDVCDTAMDGLQCINMVRENIESNNGTSCDYHIIFMDCNMPFMDGYEATTILRELLYEK